MVNVQEWMDQNYPRERKIKVTHLDIRYNNLEGSLNLEGFTSLEWISCSDNKLVSVELANLPKLRDFYCCNNKITSLKVNNCPEISLFDFKINMVESFDFQSLNPKKLKHLEVQNNKFLPQDLSFLEPFTNLEELWIGFRDQYYAGWTDHRKGIRNCFFGCIPSFFRQFDKLKVLDISNTDIDDGLENLPVSLKKLLICETNMDPKAMVNAKIYRQLNLSSSQEKDSNLRRYYDYQTWKKVSKESKLVLKSWFEKSNQEINFSISPEELKQKIKKTLKKNNIQEIDVFKTWFNPNCAIVVSESNVRKYFRYTVRLVIYEHANREIKEILHVKRFPDTNPFSGYETLEKVNEKNDEIKRKLDSDNPVLAISENNSFPTGIIEKFELEPDIDPEKYLKPLDIVWRRIPATLTYHTAIYLGNNQVAHINPLNDEINDSINQIRDKEKELENEVNSTKIEQLRKEIEELVKLKSWLEKLKREQKMSFRKIVYPAEITKKIKGKSRAKFDNWENFLKGTKSKLIRHYPIIPFKKPEQIIEHIAKTIFGQYAKGEYDLFNKNCEHFATLCVCGVAFSEQVGRTRFQIGSINLSEVIDKTDKFFSEEMIDLEEILNNIIEDNEQKKTIFNKEEIMKEDAQKRLDKIEIEIVSKRNKSLEIVQKHLYKISVLVERLEREKLSNNWEMIGIIEEELNSAKEEASQEITRKEIDSLCQTKVEVVKLQLQLEKSQQELQVLIEFPAQRLGN